jgi:malonyl-CoA/methylmalonyl-CoA synthetase
MSTNHNVYAALRDQFPADWDGWAIETDTGLSYSWRDLDRASAMMANLLTSLELPAGARVAVQVEKSVEAAVLYLATLRAGLVFLPLNTAYQKSEVEYFVADAEPAVVVCTGDHFGWVSKIAFRQGCAYVFTLNDDRSGTLLERAAHCSDQHMPANSQADDLAAILYTSGTTGRSKGAMLTHGNLLSNAQVLHRYWAWRTPEQGGDVLIHALPIFHVHGLFVALHGALLSGSPMLWMGKFDPKQAIAWMSRATVFMGVPTLYVRMLGEPALSQSATAGMRLFVSGSAPLLLETFNQWHERTGHTILERYGMSETIMLTSNPCEPDVRYAMQSERKGATVGFPLPGVALRVVDEHQRMLPAEEVGAIQVQGPNVFKGYWRMPDKTREEFTADGWFKTGDMGKQDAQGYVTIVGRSKDLIISGGYNVYPAEVEAYLNELPGVAESAVVGTPHPDFGEVGVAFVVPRPGSSPSADQLLHLLKNRLAHFKVPKRCLLVEDLPRNTMGKVQKNVLRARLNEAPIQGCASA